jgi:hypothetical protein
MAVFITWIILWFRPRYVFMFAFAAALVAFNLLPLFSAPSEYIGPLLIELTIVLAIYFVVGAGIIALRKWMKGRASAGDKEVDAELARIRAEAAQRDTNT